MVSEVESQFRWDPSWWFWRSDDSIDVDFTDVYLDIPRYVYDLHYTYFVHFIDLNQDAIFCFKERAESHESHGSLGVFNIRHLNKAPRINNSPVIDLWHEYFPSWVCLCSKNDNNPSHTRNVFKNIHITVNSSNTKLMWHCTWKMYLYRCRLLLRKPKWKRAVNLLIASVIINSLDCVHQSQCWKIYFN